MKHLISNRQFLFVSLLLFALLLVPSIASAEGFTATLQGIQTSIYPDETATFNLTIFNNASTEDYFGISSSDIEWILDTEPLLSKIGPNSKSTYLLKVKPKPYITQGPHGVHLRVSSVVSGKSAEFVPTIYIRSLSGPKTYVTNVALTPQIPEKVDSRKPVPVTIKLKNRNALDIKEIFISIEGEAVSENGEHVKTFKTSLAPLEEKTTETTISLDPNFPAGKTTITTKLEKDGQLIDSFNSEVEITPYTSKLEEVKKAGSFWVLKKEETYTIKNTGNTKIEENLIVPSSIFSIPFTKSNPEGHYGKDEKENKRGYLVPVSLNPGEEATIKVTKNYRPPFLALLLIIISIILYYWLRSPIVLIKKGELSRKKGEEEFTIKTTIIVKNRTKKHIGNLKIVDKVHSTSEIEENKKIGTIEPTKIVRKKGYGTLIRWDLDSIEPYEERVISYTVRPKVKFFGSIPLGRAKVKFETKKGTERTATSNKLVLDL